LAELQRMDGSWGWWSNDNSSPYYTAYVMFGLQIAKQAGYALPEGLYEKGLEALQQQTQKRVAKDDATLEAYQMMVAQHCGLQGLWAPDRMALDSLSNAYQAGLWMQAATLAADYALADRLEYWLTDHLMREGDAQVYWGGKRFYYSWQDDRVETTASVVRALAMKNPRHPLLPQAAQWLLAQRRGTAWHNTRQTAMTIYGLHELIKHELGGTSEVAIYANGQQVGDYRFEAGDAGKVQQGREIVLRAPQATASAGGALPEAGHLRAGLNEVRVETKVGQSYVNASIAYFLPKGHAQLKVQEKDAPFRVERAYFKLVPKTSEYGIVYQRIAVTPQNVKAGDVIMVETIVHSNDRREHVLVEDFIPAGCAFIQGDEAKGYVLEEEASNRYSGWGGDWNDGWGGWSNWFTHEEYRHNRYALTITHLGEGKHRYRYLMRAEAPGQYEANPALVQLMYYPEVRGCSTFGGLVVGKK
jgi:hypothetical protein